MQHLKWKCAAQSPLCFFISPLPLHENSAVLPAMFSSFQAVDVNDKDSTGRLSEIDLAPSEYQ